MTAPNSQNSFSFNERDILSVSDLNRQARALLEGEFNQVWVEGEISNFKPYASGHWYFTLKDENAQISCAMFANRNRAIRFHPRDGMHLIVRGRVSLYEARGNYQLIADNLIDAGEGLLKQRFEALKTNLAAEGLFEEVHKKPLPTLPRRIGVITSPTGAAVKDILTVLARRFPAIPVTLFPTPVQGKGAAPQIIEAIASADKLGECDVLIVGRGGGSLEDLWPFNEEMVARAIFDCQTPIVSAVGHEVDFTIADYVADRRAPTPSAAAELITPDQQDWQQNLVGIRTYLESQILRTLQQRQQQLDLTWRRLQHPGQRLAEQRRRLDECSARLVQGVQNKLLLTRAQISTLLAAINRHDPGSRTKPAQQTVSQLQHRLKLAANRLLEQLSQRLAANASKLHTLSPLQTLNRGYAIVTTDKTAIVRSYRQLAAGDRIHTQLSEGQIYSQVLSSHATNDDK